MKPVHLLCLALLGAGCVSRPAIGGQELAVFQRASFDLGCPRGQIFVQRLGPAGPVATFGAVGCGKKASYVASHCENHPLTGELVNCQAILSSDTKSSP